MFVATISGTSTEGTGIVMELPTAWNGGLLIPEWWSGSYFLELDFLELASVGGYRLNDAARNDAPKYQLVCRV
jgi:hypothetical protein